VPQYIKKYEITDTNKKIKISSIDIDSTLAEYAIVRIPLIRNTRNNPAKNDLYNFFIILLLKVYSR